MIKSKRTSVVSTKRSSTENISKRDRTSISHKDVDISQTNENEFSSTFQRFCLEYTTTVAPDVYVISSDSTVNKTRLHHRKSLSNGTDSTNKHSEILAVKDTTTQALTKLIFQHFIVDKNILVALLKTFQVECNITTLK